MTLKPLLFSAAALLLSATFSANAKITDRKSVV